MRWISRLLRRRPDPAPSSPETPGHREAEHALSRARQAKREIQSYWPEVKHRAARFKSEREQNHFADLFRAAMEGDRR